MSALETTTTASATEATPWRPRRGIVQKVILDHLIWWILLATLLVGSTVQGFLSLNNFINIVWGATPITLMIVGMLFVMLTGGLDLSLESIYAIAPTLGLVLLAATTGVPPQVAILICLLAGACAGLLNGVISVRLRVNPFLVTLAFLLFWRGLAIFLIPEAVYILPEGYTFLGGFRLFGFFPLAIIVCALICVIAWVVLNRTPFGKAVYAVGSNETASYVAGLNVSQVRISVFVIAGFLAGLGGLLEVGRVGAVTSDMGNGWILMVFAGVILGGASLSGGRGRLSGVVAAALELEVINNVMNLMGIQPSIRQLVFALVLLGAIYIASFQEKRRTRYV